MPAWSAEWLAVTPGLRRAPHADTTGHHPCLCVYTEECTWWGVAPASGAGLRAHTVLQVAAFLQGYQ